MAPIVSSLYLLPSAFSPKPFTLHSQLQGLETHAPGSRVNTGLPPGPLADFHAARG